MKLIYGPWGKAFDAGWPPIVASVTVAAYAMPRYVYGASEATALGIGALGAIAMVVLILLISDAVDKHVIERVENSATISAVGGAFAAAAMALLGISVISPVILTVACAIILFCFAMLAYGLAQRDIDESEWQWGWRKALLPLALIVGFVACRYTGRWEYGGTAIVVVLMVQFFWTINLWPLVVRRAT